MILNFKLMLRSYAVFFTGLCLVLNAGNVAAQNTGIAAKPPLGWNSWDSYGKYPTEKTMLVNLEAMAKKLKLSGYQYFVIDAGWDIEKDASGLLTGVAIDKYGRYIPIKNAFPNGIKPLADRAHALGLKFGIHIMRGIPRAAYKANTPIYGTKYFARDIADTTSTCTWNHDNYGVDMSKPGAQAYYDSYVGQLISWGIDFIKADDITGRPTEVQAVKAAIKKTGKSVLLSLSPGENSKVGNVAAYNEGNMLRVTKDIWDNEIGFAQAFNAWKKWSGIKERKFWLDMDMIPFGHLCLHNPDPDYLHKDNREEAKKNVRGRERMSALTDDQKYSFITLRALSASPLFMGGDLPTSDDFSLSLITNKAMLACNQNGVVGQLVYAKNGIEIWKTSNKNNPKEGWIGVFNRNTQMQTFGLNQADLGGKSMGLYNIWQNKNLGKISAKPVDIQLNAWGVLFCSYHENN